MVARVVAVLLAPHHKVDAVGGVRPSSALPAYEPAVRASTTGSTHARLPFFLLNSNERTSGTCTFTAGFGLFTVRAHSQAITVSPLCFGYRWPMRSQAFSRIHSP